MDVAAMKKRLVLFGAIEGVAVLAAAAGFIGDLVFQVPVCRALWVAAILAAVGAQIWLILPLRAQAGTGEPR